MPTAAPPKGLTSCTWNDFEFSGMSLSNSRIAIVAYRCLGAKVKLLVCAWYHEKKQKKTTLLVQSASVTYKMAFVKVSHELLFPQLILAYKIDCLWDFWTSSSRYD